MANLITTDTELTSVASAIRAKTGGTAQLEYPAEFISEIGDIVTIGDAVTENLTAANIKAGVTVKVGDTDDDDSVASVTGEFTSDADATAGDIMSGKSAYVNGVKVDGSYTLAGATSDANAAAGDIVSGKTAYVNGSKITGEYTLAAHTQGTAAAGDIKSGKTAYVNGAEVTGTYDPMAELSVKQKTFTFEFVATSSISVNKGGYVFLNGTCEGLDMSGLVIDDDLTMKTIGTVETNITTTYLHVSCNGLIKSDGEIKARFYVRNTYSQGAMSITSGKYIRVPVTMYVSTYTDETEGQNNG